MSFFPAKSWPAPVQFFVRPMLLISLGLHGLLLLVPLSPNRHPVLAKREAAVKITQLPVSTSSAANSTRQGQRSTKRTALPKRPPRAVATGTQTVKSQASLASAGGTSNSEAKATNGVSKATNGSANGASQAEGISSPFADFPHYPGAEPGCFGKTACRQTGDAIDQVAAHFNRQLPAKKYEADPSTNEPNRKIYQVLKGGITQYLNLFTHAGGTVYVLAPKPMTSLAEIQKAIEVPDDLVTLLGQLASHPAEDTDFNEPTYFYSKLSREDKDGSVLPAELKPDVAAEAPPKLVTGQTPETVREKLASNLESKGLKLSLAGNFGGGDLFELQKGSAIAGYVNLVPSNNRTGTIIVVWNRTPG